MGNNDRFEKLSMLGELDEKYIKEADRYISERLDADRAVIRLAPERRKFSWKSFTAIAACAAVLAGGSAVLANYLRSRPVVPPVPATSDPGDNSGEVSNSEGTDNPTDPYLESVRKQYNISDDIKISYLKDGWEWTKFSVGGDAFYGPMVTSRLQNNAALLDENTMITVRDDENGLKEIAAYDLKNGTFRTIFGDNDEPFVDEGTVMDYTLCYADDHKIVFFANFIQGATMLKRELRVIDVSDDNEDCGPWFAVPNGGNLLYGDMLIEDNRLYFTADGSGSYTPGNNSLYRYDLSLKGASELESLGVEAFKLYSCNGEVIYSTIAGTFGGGMFDDDTQTLYKLEGGTPIDNEKYANAYVIKNAGYFSKSDTLTNCVTGETLFELPEDAVVDGFSDSCITFGNLYDAKPDYFLFDAENNELFVYKDSALEVNSIDWKWYKFGDGFCIFNEGVNARSDGYILTRKSSTDQGTDTPKPEDGRIKSLKEKYSIDIPVGYMEDNFNVAQYDLPEFINGKNAGYQEVGVISKDRIVAELFTDDNRGLKEFGIYNFTDGSYEPIYVPSDDKLKESHLIYADTEYLVFTTFAEGQDSGSDPSHYSMYLIDHASGDYTPVPVFTDKDDVVPMISADMVLLDGCLYFDTYYGENWLSNDPIYRYHIGSKTFEKIVEYGTDPKIYKGNVVYTSRNDAEATEIRSIDGNIEFKNGPNGFWVCKNDIFKLDQNWRGLTSAVTGKRLIGGGTQFFMESSCGKYISFNDFHINETRSQSDFVYDFASDRMLIYDDVDGAVCNYWLNDGTGVSFFYHYTGGENSRETPYQINVFTEKQ